MNRFVRYAAFLYGITAGTNVMAVEEPDYSVSGQHEAIEFRMYEPYLIAETEVLDAGSRSDAVNTGFRRLFSYISGNNSGNARLAMTAPVQQQPSGQKIAMTAPVRQAASDAGWLVSFVVPREFDAATVPTPGDPAVKIREVPGQLMAVLTYSGRWSDANQEQHTALLLEALARLGINPIAPPVGAAYNSPFTLPFLRRNEVMVAIPADSKLPQR